MLTSTLKTVLGIASIREVKLENYSCFNYEPVLDAIRESHPDSHKVSLVERKASTIVDLWEVNACSWGVESWSPFSNLDWEDATR
jgi:hypothetical protein